ncbi:hypothetical protein [Saccharopolyspora erythraea]|nr:hypothetical protein [Saccharopolyspora erythraea]
MTVDFPGVQGRAWPVVERHGPLPAARPHLDRGDLSEAAVRLPQ